ncbi:MAG: carbonic anhydrase [Bdellovibrionota bacterium]
MRMFRRWRFIMELANKKSNQVLKSLLEGNNRFLSGLKNIETIATPEKLKQLATNGQRPSCIILACSDSRVPAELIFDQGLGDLFVLRVAGNVVAPSLIASMEFAVLNFESPLILVMGHTKCGAINAACSHFVNPQKELSKNLEDLIRRISPAVRGSYLEGQNEQQFIDKTISANVRESISEIFAHSSIISKKVQDNELAVVGAVFELESGRVVVDQAFDYNYSANKQTNYSEPPQTVKA